MQLCRLLDSAIKTHFSTRPVDPENDEKCIVRHINHEKRVNAATERLQSVRAIAVGASASIFFFSPQSILTMNALTFPGVRDLLGSALLGSQKLLNTLRLAGHLCERRTADSVTNRSYDFAASVLCPALSDGAPFRVSCSLTWPLE